VYPAIDWALSSAVIWDHLPPAEFVPGISVGPLKLQQAQEVFAYQPSIKDTYPRNVASERP
jgi:hypothetical protein